MTAIAGVVHEGRIWLGGDSAGVSGYDLNVRTDPKVFQVGDVLIGYTTSFRMGQILQYHLTPPKRFADESPMQHMVTRFVPEVIKIFKDHGFNRSVEAVESGGRFIVGFAGELFEIQSDYQVARYGDCCACGCGDHLILGSLFSTVGLHPVVRIDVALRAAEQYSAGVRRPFHIIDEDGNECDVVTPTESDATAG